MYEQIFIAEKPSLGRDIAKGIVALSKRPGNENGDTMQAVGSTHIIIGGKIVVTWFYGHMLELCEPEDYNPAYKGGFRKSVHLLPWVPDRWLIKPIDKSISQLNLVKGLIDRSKTIVNAGDPDREGQLLIDEALVFFGNQKPVLRLLLNAADTESVKQALLSVRDNKDFESMFHAAEARQRSDILVGVNMTRACTVANVMPDMLTVGRVQTPTLALVVKRELEIINFKPTTFYEPKPEFVHANGKYTGEWIPDEGQKGLDSEKRLIDEMTAKRIAVGCEGKTGNIADYTVKPGSQTQPLPHSLSTLQAKASAKFGMSAEMVLQICQSLYETHKIASYPRTDSQFLKESQHGDFDKVASAISKFDPAIEKLIEGADRTIRSPAWNDKKVVAHHGIIPTSSPNYSSLSPNERKIFGLIVQGYIAQFYPEYTYTQTTVITECAGHRFKSNGRTPVDLGWKKVMGADDEEETVNPKKSGEEEQLLPLMKAGDSVACPKVEFGKKTTKPPRRYKEGTLLMAMQRVADTVDDPVLKKKLEQCKGIGTPATQSKIIERLKEVGFIEVEKKTSVLIPSKGAIEFIGGLPKEITSAATTAMWETALDRIERKEITLDEFMASQIDWISKLTRRTLESKLSISLTKKAPVDSLKSAGAGNTCPKCNTGTMLPRKASTGQNAGNYFLGCSNYPTCRHTQNVEQSKAPQDSKAKGGGKASGSGSKGKGGATASTTAAKTTQGVPTPATPTAKKFSTFGSR